MGKYEKLQAAYNSLNRQGSNLAAHAHRLEHDNQRLYHAFNQVRAELAQVLWAREQMRQEALQRLGAADVEIEQLSERLRTQVELLPFPPP